MGCYSNRLVAGSSLVFHHLQHERAGGVSLVHNLPTFLSCKVQKAREGPGNKAKVLVAIQCCSLALSTSNCGTGMCARGRERQDAVTDRSYDLRS